MAKNYIQDGDVLTLTAPAGGVVSGGVYAIGTLVVVAIADAAAGAQFAGKATGVWRLPAAAGLTAGAAVGLLDGELVAASTENAVPAGKLVTATADGFADSVGDYVSSNGAVLASGLELMVDKDVERLDMVSGAIDRAVTVTAERSQITPLDRKGGFVVNGQTWHIDGIASDDGHLITFYVVP